MENSGLAVSAEMLERFKTEFNSHPAEVGYIV